ncbi:MAG TPA: sugar ABC transporter ATP-binding protein [Acidimicrobiales bacterium]|nr:sugar ABC transporter ATP-binding protein [Acidimicrobiales bacterium]
MSEEASAGTLSPAGAVGEAVGASGVTKTFGAVRALEKADLSVAFGEVHALVGENGAGKSTLIKVLCGALQPDQGEIRVRGGRVGLSNPAKARSLGIGTVFQELTLFPWLSVAENLLLQREPRGRSGLMRRRGLVPEATRMLASLGIEQVDPGALVAELSLAERQVIEIANTVLREPEIVFFDEPTSSLVEQDVRWLFALIGRLRSAGKAVVFTSHRWQEVTHLADRITVFRNGTSVGTFTSLGESEAVKLMTGKSVDAIYPASASAPTDQALLEVSQLSGRGLSELSFEIRRGEILGVGGLAGQGHRELFLTLFGMQRATGGRTLVGGRPVRLRSPRAAMRAGLGIAFVPEDRKAEGLLMPMSVLQNMTLVVLGQLSRAGFLRPREERRRAGVVLNQLNVRSSGPDQPVRALSGGNQQKVLIGRWLLADSRILLLYDVTRGVDMGAKHEIYELMVALAAEGRGLLFYSSDTEELAHLSHRVLVLREGRVTSELAGPKIEPEEIVRASIFDVTGSRTRD